MTELPLCTWCHEAHPERDGQPLCPACFARLLYQVYGGPDYLLQRDLADGRHIDVMPLLFDQARLLLSPPGPRVAADGSWDYQDWLMAMHVAEQWDGEGAPWGYARDNATANRS